ncbi:hypothetical protein [Ramlibacter sp.]|uniref:hypothetical protein n=1 Tax=Ramlibacter sp. TaxID=1917967 RepID=UPI0026360B49|nr:hypothetical protein [Ramlibacter sp.]
MVSPSASPSPEPEPELKPPEFRVPRGRSGVGANSALETWVGDVQRIQRAKAAYGELYSSKDRPHLLT